MSRFPISLFAGDKRTGQTTSVRKTDTEIAFLFTPSLLSLSFRLFLSLSLSGSVQKLARRKIAQMYYISLSFSHSLPFLNPFPSFSFLQVRSAQFKISVRSAKSKTFYLAREREREAEMFSLMITPLLSFLPGLSLSLSLAPTLPSPLLLSLSLFLPSSLVGFLASRSVQQLTDGADE